MVSNKKIFIYFHNVVYSIQNSIYFRSHKCHIIFYFYNKRPFLSNPNSTYLHYVHGSCPHANLASAPTCFFWLHLTPVASVYHMVFFFSVNKCGLDNTAVGSPILLLLKIILYFLFNIIALIWYKYYNLIAFL